MKDTRPLPRVTLDPDGRHIWWAHECVALPGQGDPYFDGWDEVMLPANVSHGWTVVSQEPLTVAPSILCSRCNTHGFWENDGWREV